MGTHLGRRTLSCLMLLAVAGTAGVVGYHTIQQQKVSTPWVLAGSYTSSVSATPATATQPTGTASTSKPQFIMEIPKIKQSIPVSTVGLNQEGQMSVPADTTYAGWYKYGARPGQAGSAVIDGHNRILGKGNGVFWNINKLASGDDIYIENGSSARLHFVVRSTHTYDVASAPMSAIFGAADRAHLNLITCAGKWDRKQQNYTQRLVVYTELADEPGGVAKL